MVAIAQIVESFAYGTAKSVVQLCELLSDNDQVTVFYGHRQGTEIDLQSSSQRVQWRPLPGRGKTKHIANMRFLREQLRGSFDVLHGHSAYGGLYAKVLGPQLGIKTLYSPRGFSFLREDFPAIGRKVFRAVEKATARRCITVCCGPYEQTLAQSLGGQCVRINNGYDVTAPVSIDRVSNNVLGVGRICHQKGFDIFTDVARRLPENSFTWVGDIQSGKASALENVPPNVDVISYLPHHELLEKVKFARLILLPSRWEGLSRFLIESVCLGKAIVTSRFPGNLDCLDGDSSGESFANGMACRTTDDYVLAVRQLSRDDETLDRMQWASHRYAAENFDLQSIREQWKSLYQSFGNKRFDREIGV